VQLKIKGICWYQSLEPFSNPRVQVDSCRAYQTLKRDLTHKLGVTRSCHSPGGDHNVEWS
jgi:hypothetical protein